MSAFQKFLTTPLGSALRVFAGLVLGYLVLDLSTDGRLAVSVEDVQTWVAAAAAIALPILIAAINPADPRFGINKPTT